MSTTAGTTARAVGRFTFADLGVRAKVLVAVGLAALVAVIVGMVGLVSLSRTNSAAQLIYTSSLASIKGVATIKATVLQARVDVAMQALSRDPAAVEKFTDGYKKDVADFATAMAAYRAGMPAGSAATIADLDSNFEAYAQLAQNKMLPAGVRNDLIGWAKIRDAEALPIMTKVYGNLAELDATATKDAAKNADAAKATYRTGRLLSITVLTIGLLLALAVGLLVAGKIVAALRKVEDVCHALAADDLTGSTGITSNDETGRMGRALDAAVANLRRTVSTIDGSASSLASASEQMTSTSSTIAASAEETSAQAQAVSAAAEQVSRSVETVSAGSEEMGASIREISENASEAARVAAEAVSVTATTSATMSQLGDSSAEIGNVIKVITSIAEQTNLLALNATIEAARAGDAGKGFAVVASEVKDLAQETARATEDISRRVQAIQSDTTGAVEAIEQISQVIARISDYQTTIASAVEEQTATTAEMSRSVTEAAGGAGDIAENITGVANAARQTSEGIAETRMATAELARMSTELKTLVANFRY